MTDRLAFVAPSGIATAKAVKEAIGISTGPGDPLTGVVSAMSDGTVSGVLPSDTVQWLTAAKQEEQL